MHALLWPTLTTSSPISQAILVLLQSRFKSLFWSSPCKVGHNYREYGILLKLWSGLHCSPIGSVSLTPVSGECNQIWRSQWKTNLPEACASSSTNSMHIQVNHRNWGAYQCTFPILTEVPPHMWTTGTFPAVPHSNLGGEVSWLYQLQHCQKGRRHQSSVEIHHFPPASQSWLLMSNKKVKNVILHPQKGQHQRTLPPTQQANH